MARALNISLPTKPQHELRPVNTWHLHTGHVKLFIVGPGEDDWFACSKANYDGPVGTPRERIIAQRAVQLLNLHHRHSQDIGRAAFDAILKQAAAKPSAH